MQLLILLLSHFVSYFSCEFLATYHPAFSMRINIDFSLKTDKKRTEKETMAKNRKMKIWDLELINLIHRNFRGDNVSCDLSIVVSRF